ncbi:hypothetical protein HZA96_01520 [Candidatus Woesearchaeota archaeon]|nr:hypothetical protein [Candidatus Woesearchaeota archaeon]
MLTTIINNCWRTIKYSAIALTATLVMQTAKPAKAHEINVHQWITEQAVEYICQKQEHKKICDEIKPMLAILKEGVADEDSIFPAMNKSVDYNAMCNIAGDTRTRFFNHFFRPIDNKGYLNSSPIASHQFKNAMDWGLNDKYNLCDLEDSIRLYQQNKKRAYFALAHVLHLVQDVTLPEHTNLEAHAFIAPAGFVITNQFGFEHYCDITLQNKKTLPLLDKNNPLRIRSIEDYFRLGSFVGYTINRFSANLKDTEREKKGAELGILGKMFPSLHYQDQWVDLANTGWRIDGNHWKHDLNPYFEGMWRGSYAILDDWWQTKDFPKPANEKEKEDWFYIEASMQAFPEIFKIGWVERFTQLDSINEVQQLFRMVINKDNESHYTKTPKFPERKSLAALLADELIPLAIEDTAGSIIWYWQQVHKETNKTKREDIGAEIINITNNSEGIIVSSFINGKERRLIVETTNIALSKGPIIADICDNPGNEMIEQKMGRINNAEYLQIHDSHGKLIFNKKDDIINYNIYSLANIVNSDPQYEIFLYSKGNEQLVNGTKLPVINIYKCFGTDIKLIYNYLLSPLQLPNPLSRHGRSYIEKSFNISFLHNNQITVFFRYNEFKSDSQKIIFNQSNGLFEYNPQKRMFVNIK